MLGEGKDQWLRERWRCQRRIDPEILPLEEQIRQRDFEIYLQRGGQDESDLDDWQQAEAEL